MQFKKMKCNIENSDDYKHLRKNEISALNNP